MPKRASSLDRWTTSLVMSACLLLGCVAEKESLHESDHELPPHWPQNLEDAAAKIEQRIGTTGDEQTQATAREEVSDLIEWAPEVAADTDLTEIQWMPIFELSETLRHHLLAKDVSLVDCRDDIKRLIDVLRESQSILNVKSAEEAKQ